MVDYISLQNLKPRGVIHARVERVSLRAVQRLPSIEVFF